MAKLKNLKDSISLLIQIILTYIPLLAPKNRGGIYHLLLAMLLMWLSLQVRYVIAPVNAGLQYVAFFPAVTIAAICGGYKPGLLATVIGLAFATFIFTPPYYTISIETIKIAFWPNIVFLIDGSIVSFSIEAMHRYREKYVSELNLATESHQALIRSTIHLKQILDNLFAYVALLDTSGIILEVNKAPLERGGLLREDVIGQYFYDAPWWSYDEQVRSRLIQAIEAAAAGQTSRYDALIKMGADLICIDFQISPVRDEYNHIVGLLPTGVDISARKQAEAVSSRYKVVIDATRDGFWVLNREGYILEVNQAYADLSGYTVDELQNLHVTQLEAINNTDEIQEHIARIASQGYDLFESSHRKKNGEVFEVEISVNYIAQLQLFFAFFRDISERRKAQKEISRLLSRQLAILDGANYSIIATDYNGLITDFNATAERMLGYNADEMIGKQTPAIIHDKQEVISHAETLSHELGYAVEPGFDVFVAKAKTGRVEEREWTYIQRDGSRFPVLLSVTPMFDEKKQIFGFMGIASDISERKKAEDALRIAAVTFETHEAIMITDANANILRVNHAFEVITGFRGDEVIGKNPSVLSSGRHDKSFYQLMWLKLISTGIWAGEIWDRRKSGQIYPKSLRITALKDSEGSLTGYVAIFSDITERKQAEEEIRNLAFYDPLTRLPNRRLLLDRLELALNSSERNRQYGALLFLDMDKFKFLNDILGHNVGDQMLIEVGSRIKSSVREVDTVSRFGGDEFVVLFEDLGFDAKEVSHKMALIAEKIRAALAVPFHFNQHVHNSSPSIGVCLFFGHTLSSENLIKQADIAMYQAKNAGRNRVQFFDPVLQKSVETRAILESDLRHALSLQQFQLYYQVQCDNNLLPYGAEALIRWHHPKRGMISPLQFISIAEESTLIQEIGLWVIETACQQLVLWSKSDSTRDLILAINVSANQFMMTDFVELIETSIKSYGVQPSRLKLELTESVILNNIEDIVNKMRLLKAFGIKLSLDDFGTGYSSLSYLKQLPIDQIKIDQSFVRDIATDPNDAVMVKNIIDIAKNFQLNVIAEGVETGEQLAFLKQNGCMAYQGYFFGKPLPIEQFEKQLKRSR